MIGTGRSDHIDVDLGCGVGRFHASASGLDSSSGRSVVYLSSSYVEDTIRDRSNSLVRISFCSQRAKHEK